MQHWEKIKVALPLIVQKIMVFIVPFKATIGVAPFFTNNTPNVHFYGMLWSSF